MTYKAGDKVRRTSHPTELSDDIRVGDTAVIRHVSVSVGVHGVVNERNGCYQPWNDAYFQLVDSPQPQALDSHFVPLQEGDRVRHETLGEGKINTLSVERGTASIYFDDGWDCQIAVALDLLTKVEPEEGVTEDEQAARKVLSRLMRITTDGGGLDLSTSEAQLLWEYIERLRQSASTPELQIEEESGKQIFPITYDDIRLWCTSEGDHVTVDGYVNVVQLLDFVKAFTSPFDNAPTAPKDETVTVGFVSVDSPKEQEADYFQGFTAGNEPHPWMAATGSEGLCELCGCGRDGGFHKQWEQAGPVDPQPEKTLREKRLFTLQLGLDCFLRDQNVEITASEIVALRNQLLIDLAHVDREHFNSKREEIARRWDADQIESILFGDKP